MNVVSLIFGVLLLAAGRRLYWLFVGAVGFGIGLVLAQEYFGPDGTGGRDAWIAFAIAITGGIVGAILAVLFQKLAVGLAGAAAGGFFGWTLFKTMEAGTWAWIGLIIGAILGGILVLKLFDWGLIVVSSLAGAGFLVDGIKVDKSTEGLLLVMAFILGVIVQGAQLLQARRTRELAERSETTVKP